MEKKEHIPTPAVRRLSLYLRQLELFVGAGRQKISSKQLGTALRLSDAQVRKDLAYFGQFGHPGIGYRVPELIQRLRRILGTDKLSKVLVVGVGNLGRALLSFRGFAKHGFEVVAAFDCDPAKFGEEVPLGSGVRVQSMNELSKVVRHQCIRLGVLTVPALAAQSAAEDMVAAGVRAILNFAPVTLQLKPDISVTSVDLGVHLEQLAFRMSGASLG